MTVQWRKHEYLLVAGLTLLTIVLLVIQDSGRPSALLGEIVSLVLLGLGYAAINLVVIYFGALRRRTKKQWMLRLFGLVAAWLGISYLLGPGVNFLSFYAGPAYFGFDGAPLTIGFHPQPFPNVFGGWDIALALTGLYFGYAFVRDRLSSFLQRDSADRTYWILAVNRATALLAVATALPFVLAAFLKMGRNFFGEYFAIVIPAIFTALLAYYWLLPAFARDRKPVRLAWRLAACILGCTLSFSALLGDDWTFNLLLTEIVLQAAVLLPLVAILYRNSKDAATELHDTQTLLADTEATLQGLRAQINPHFLFNALNGLYAITLREKAEDAAAGVRQLADMMRYMLYDNQQDVIPLQTELDYLENYVALQKLRLVRPEETIVLDIVASGTEGVIAPMLLIPFVENAFKHGISTEHPSWITIRLACTGGELRLEVRNSLHPALAMEKKTPWSGTGLRNVHRRLDLLYPRRHTLEYGPVGQEHAALLTIQLSDKP